MGCVNSKANLYMKRTPLKRKTALKSTGFKKPTDGKWSSFKAPEPGQWSSFKKADTAAISSKSSNKASAKPATLITPQAIKKASTRRKNSMQGAGRSKADIEYHSKLISIGCIACLIAGESSGHPLQIHHTSGRNKGLLNDLSERFAIALCAEHHDQRIYSGFYAGSTFIPVRVDEPSVHHRKADFTKKFGSQHLLVHESHRLAHETPIWMSEEEWSGYLKCNAESREVFLREIYLAISMKDRRTLINA